MTSWDEFYRELMNDDQRPAGTRPPQPLWCSLGTILLPWEATGCIWWFGIHWTIIALGLIYAVAFLIALGATVERVRKGEL